MKCKDEKGQTFNCDASCAARHAKLVACHTGVEACVRFGYVPYAKVTVVQNGNPVVKREEKMFFKKAFILLASVCTIINTCCNPHLVKM